MMADKSKQVRERAEAQFKKTAQASDRHSAATEYKTEALAIQEKTARLRSMRIAKEAADSQAEAAEAAGAQAALGKGAVVGKKP